jgi:pyroglutamyl-peptidase
MRTILLTGFEPFGRWKRNVTSEATAALDGAVRSGFVLRALELPVAWPRARDAVLRALARVKPVAVVAFGIHRHRRGIFRVETRAANRLEFRIPDNEGNVRRGEKIEAAGPRSLRASIDALALGAAIRAAGIRVRPSDDAGRYLCNAVYYTLLRAAPRAVFVHVPPRLPEEGMDDVVTAVDAAASFVAASLEPAVSRRGGRSARSWASS